MIKFYSHPLFSKSRCVWISLLEKNLNFEIIEVNLSSNLLEPNFLAIDLFHQIPFLVDENSRAIESLAIMDYLEAKYPTPALLPKSPASLAKVKTIEFINNNHLSPQINALFRQKMSLSPGINPIKIDRSKIDLVLQFYEENLQDNSYFIDKRFTLADLVAGVSVSSLVLFDFSLDNYPKIQNWLAKLQQRDSFQNTKLSLEDIEIIDEIHSFI